MISNGGSTTGYQALAESRPVLGVASNLDQYLAMTAIAGAGAGILLRAGTVDQPQVRAALHDLLERPAFATAATDLGQEFRRWDGPALFSAWLARTIG